MVLIVVLKFGRFYTLSTDGTVVHGSMNTLPSRPRPIPPSLLLEPKSYSADSIRVAGTSKAGIRVLISTLHLVLANDETLIVVSLKQLIKALDNCLICVKTVVS